MRLTAEVERLTVQNNDLRRRMANARKRESILQEEHIKLTGEEYQFRGVWTNGMDNSVIEGDTGVETFGRDVRAEHKAREG